MTSKSDMPSIDPDPRDCATAWFAVLERARLDNDFARAADAVRELRRLGVQVKFDRKREGGRP